MTSSNSSQLVSVEKTFACRLVKFKACALATVLQCLLESWMLQKHCLGWPCTNAHPPYTGILLQHSDSIKNKWNSRCRIVPSIFQILNLRLGIFLVHIKVSF